MAWGWNGEGGLGNPGAGGESLVPVSVSGLSGATAIASGYRHSLAVGSPPPPLPQIVNLTPPYGAGGGGTSVKITGLNFTGVKAVRFGASDAESYTVNSETEITAVSPPGTGEIGRCR